MPVRIPPQAENTTNKGPEAALAQTTGSVRPHETRALRPSHLLRLQPLERGLI